MADRQAYLYFRLMSATAQLMKMFAETPLYRERVNWHYIYSLFQRLKVIADLIMSNATIAVSLDDFESRIVELENVIVRLEQNLIVP